MPAALLEEVINQSSPAAISVWPRAFIRSTTRAGIPWALFRGPHSLVPLTTTALPGGPSLCQRLLVEAMPLVHGVRLRKGRKEPTLKVAATRPRPEAG